VHACVVRSQSWLAWHADLLRASAPPREPAFPFPVPAIDAIDGGFSRYGHSIKACYLRQNLFSVEGRQTSPKPRETSPESQQTSPKSQGILSILNKLNGGENMICRIII